MITGKPAGLSCAGGADLEGHAGSERLNVCPDGHKRRGLQWGGRQESHGTMLLHK